MTSKLRIYADFNSRAPGNGACWCLRYGPTLRPLDELEAELGLSPGLEVVLYYEDPSEEFEVDGMLLDEDDGFAKWHALPNWGTFRRLRG